MSTARIRELPLKTGAVAGAVAYLLGYVFTYLLVADDIRESLGNRLTEIIVGQDVTYQAVGWVFYNAHLVPTVFEVESPIFGGSSSADLISQVDVFSSGLYLLPVLLLFGAGLAVGRRHRGRADVAEAAKTGVTVVVGYFPLAAVGAFVFRFRSDATAAGPDMLLALVLAGLGYPLALGALGSVVAGQTQS